MPATEESESASSPEPTQEVSRKPRLPGERSKGSVSLATPLLSRIARRRRTPRRATTSRFDDADGPVGVHKNFIGDAANIRLGDLIDAIDRAEEFTPVSVASLVSRQLSREAFVVGQTADQIGLATRFDHLQLFVADVFFFQTVDFGMNGFGHFLRLVAGQGHREKCEEVRILDAGVSGESFRE